MSWALALSEEVRGDKPLAVACGRHRIALWRSPEGDVYAVEDRCPHRRAPLSLGCVLPNGNIRCGYHGWSYDGDTGMLKNIPNLKGEQKFSSLYKVKTYPCREESGLIRVALNGEVTPGVPSGDTLARSGVVALALDYEEYLNALFDGPWLIFSIPGVRMTEYFHGDPHWQDGHIVLKRWCHWAGRRIDSRFTEDFPLLLHSATNPQTGETAFSLRDMDRRELIRATLAPAPAERGVTAIRWRAERGSSVPPMRKLWLSRRSPIRHRQWVDGAKLRKLLKSASTPFQKLRQGSLKSADIIWHGGFDYAETR